MADPESTQGQTVSVPTWERTQPASPPLSSGGGEFRRDPLYGPRLSDDIDALSSTIGWAPWMRLLRRHEQRLVDRRRAARQPREPVDQSMHS